MEDYISSEITDNIDSKSSNNDSCIWNEQTKNENSKNEIEGIKKNPKL